MLQSMVKEDYDKLMTKMRRPKGEEIETMRRFINKKVEVISLWDGKMQMEVGVLTDINHEQIYIPPITVPFSGRYCGVISFACDGNIIYDINSLA
ncbi:MAG: hypothetical protein WC819_01295 [Parcubacteria group bacterium]|jgi:hypothetical protein